MGSSNRHWPSMFKSKPSHHQWQNHDLISSHRTTPYTPGGGGGGGNSCEERSPEPKPRWNPRPEQIRILEAIFNSGMVNPPRDEIRKIRGQLQEYGQVGDANVFYWFQNRKSRSKHKQRQLQNAKSSHPPPPPVSAAAPSSSSSSSNKSSSSDKSVPTAAITDLLNSPTTSVNQPFFQNDFLVEPLVFPVSDQSLQDTCPSFLYSELMLTSYEQQLLLPQPSFSLPSPTFQGPTKSTVFINDVCFEVGSGPFNVREAFGDDAVLIDSTGLAVAMDGWGVTVQPLRHGGFYYLIRPFSSTAPPTHHDTTTIDLI